jgi:hypothetical protein
MSQRLLAATANFGSGFQPPSSAFSNGSGTDASGAAAAGNLEKFISNAIGALTLIGGLFFIFYFVMGALNWITSGGEKGKIDKARDQMVQAVMGMVVIVISYALIGVIGTFLGLDLLNPAQALLKL